MNLLIIRLTVSTSKLYSILYFLEHYSFKMFCSFTPYFDREPSPFMYFVYLSVVRCFSPSPKKYHFLDLVLSCLLLLWDYLIFIVNQVYEFSFVRLFLTHCRLFLSILALLLFLRFWLMLGVASLGFGQSLVVFDVVFPVVGLPSIVFARIGFQDLAFGDLTSMLSFITRRRFHGLLILLRLPFLMLFYLVAAFIAVHISGASPFRYVCQSRFG